MGSREKHVMMSLALNVKKFQPKFARMYVLKYQTRFAKRYLVKIAFLSQEMFAAIFPEMNATPFLSKRKLKTASKFQDKSVPMFQRKNVDLFPNRNAKTTKYRIAKTCALITIGARNARLDKFVGHRSKKLIAWPSVKHCFVILYIICSIFILTSDLIEF